MYNTNWPLNPTPSTSNGRESRSSLGRRSLEFEFLVDWSALADSWMQQREQQAQWQHHVAAAAPPPPPPPPPPPQFLLTGPPIPPPGPPPMGMSFPPFPMALHPQHHQLQVGSHIAQESFTITNMESKFGHEFLFELTTIKSYRLKFNCGIDRDIRCFASLHLPLDSVRFDILQHLDSPWRPAPPSMMMSVAPPPPPLPQWRPTPPNPPLFPIQQVSSSSRKTRSSSSRLPFRTFQRLFLLEISGHP